MNYDLAIASTCVAGNAYPSGAPGGFNGVVLLDL